MLLQFITPISATVTLFQASNRGATPIGIILVLLLLVIALYWWGVNRPSYDQIKQVESVETAVDHPQTPDPHHATASHQETPTEPDDLKRIEGIGPKIEKILQAAGIQTFAQLAATEVSQLEKIVREDAGIRLAYPATWPQQAQLAAADEWEAFAKLQEQLQGGRQK